MNPPYTGIPNSASLWSYPSGLKRSRGIWTVEEGVELGSGSDSQMRLGVGVGVGLRVRVRVRVRIRVRIRVRVRG